MRNPSELGSKGVCFTPWEYTHWVLTPSKRTIPGHAIPGCNTQTLRLGAYALKSPIPSPESRIPNPGSRISDPESRIPKSRKCDSSPESRIPNPESRNPENVIRAPNPEIGSDLWIATRKHLLQQMEALPLQIPLVSGMMLSSDSKINFQMLPEKQSCLERRASKSAKRLRGKRNRMIRFLWGA